jgi:hypothetical protein
VTRPSIPACGRAHREPRLRDERRDPGPLRPAPRGGQHASCS